MDSISLLTFRVFCSFAFIIGWLIVFKPNLVIKLLSYGRANVEDVPRFLLWFLQAAAILVIIDLLFDTVQGIL